MGLLLSEGVTISAQVGSPFTPGLYTEAQVVGWQLAIEAMHEASGLLFAQLWRAGRAGHSSVRNGELPEPHRPGASQVSSPGLT